MATVMHLMLSHDKNLRRIQKVQRVQYDGQKVLLSHVHKRIHVHDHAPHEVHKRVHIQHREQDEGDGLDAHTHVHNLKLTKIFLQLKLLTITDIDIGLVYLSLFEIF